MNNGKFITVEGVEGAGKSTAMQFIRQLIEAAGHQVVVTREPGGTEIAENIRQVLLHAPSNEVMQPETELLLMFAGRAQHVAACIKPALHSGKWVLSDRFVDASYAYQGGGRGIAANNIEALDQWIVGQYYPDLTLLLDLPADLGLARAALRSIQRDRIEQEKIDFFNYVRQAYLDRAKADPARIKIIDASQDVVAVQNQIQAALREIL
jgi:dTMP kinase